MSQSTAKIEHLIIASVSRFGEISPFGQFFDSLFRTWQNAEDPFANL